MRKKKEELFVQNRLANKETVKSQCSSSRFNLNLPFELSMDNSNEPAFSDNNTDSISRFCSIIGKECCPKINNRMWDKRKYYLYDTENLTDELNVRVSNNSICIICDCQKSFYKK